jgi:hypothetical protein
MGEIGLIGLTVVVLAIVFAWINYGFASPKRRQRIDERRRVRSQALVAGRPGSSGRPPYRDNSSGVGEDSTH